MGADDQGPEAWGFMSEEQRSRFARTWRAWRERGWKACNRARGLSSVERRVLHEIISHVQIGDSADVNQLVGTKDAAEIARLLDLNVSTVASARQQLRKKRILIHSRATGGRKQAATDVISLNWIKAVEDDVDQRPGRKPKPSPRGQEFQDPKLSPTGQEFTQKKLSPSDAKLSPFDPNTLAFSPQNSRHRGETHLNQSISSSSSRTPEQASQPAALTHADARVSPAAAAQRMKPIPKWDVEHRLGVLCQRLNGMWPARRLKDYPLWDWQPDVDIQPLRDAIADHIRIDALAKGIELMLDENVVGITHAARLARASEIARARQAQRKPDGTGHYALRRKFQLNRRGW
jgi:hypothetical protein